MRQYQQLKNGLVERCMEFAGALEFAKDFPEGAKGFAEVDATQKDLEVAIESMTQVWDYDYDGLTEQDMADELTQCFKIRKVKCF